MTPDPQEARVQEIFADAGGLSAEERRGYLDRVCHGESALRAKVDALLGAHYQAGTFLTAPAAELDRKPSPAELSGTRIGRYKVLEIIGEGGFATVYRAEQQEPVRREVALKIIKIGMDTR